MEDGGKEERNKGSTQRCDSVCICMCVHVWRDQFVAVSFKYYNSSIQQGTDGRLYLKVGKKTYQIKKKKNFSL